MNSTNVHTILLHSQQQHSLVASKYLQKLCVCTALSPQPSNKEAMPLLPNTGYIQLLYEQKPDCQIWHINNVEPTKKWVARCYHSVEVMQHTSSPLGRQVHREGISRIRALTIIVTLHLLAGVPLSTSWQAFAEVYNQTLTTTLNTTGTKALSPSTHKGHLYTICVNRAMTKSQLTR